MKYIKIIYNFIFLVVAILVVLVINFTKFRALDDYLSYPIYEGIYESSEEVIFKVDEDTMYTSKLKLEIIKNEEKQKINKYSPYSFKFNIIIFTDKEEKIKTRFELSTYSDRILLDFTIKDRFQEITLIIRKKYLYIHKSNHIIYQGAYSGLYYKGLAIKLKKS